MNRVAVTGLGIVSSLGNSYEELTESLRSGKSGITTVAKAKELGGVTTSGGLVQNFEELLIRSELPEARLASMSRVAQYAVMASKEAVGRSRLTREELGDSRTACFVGSGAATAYPIRINGHHVHDRRLDLVDRNVTLQTVGNACSLHVADVFGIGGPAFGLT